MEFHVSKKGSDGNAGTARQPFLTISKAASLAEEGDRVIVHEGVYREWVKPKNGSRTAQRRIVYQAAEGERVVIKGSEQIAGWQSAGNIWQVAVSNDMFGDLNPYAEIIEGDWFMEPIVSRIHTGQVYLNGVSLREVSDAWAVKESILTWHAEVGGEETVIYANFGDADPNEELAEINVRRSCFCPEETGINFITVSGFEFAQAATQWAPPTAEQTGMLCTNWSKGWIIENNILHDSRCSAISVGKEISTGNNLHTHYHRKPGYQTQLETVFAARHIGWDRERIGSHIIRNNTIYDCGQNAIVGHMGGAFSEICGNHIHHIGDRHEFFGFEIAGIKLHAAIDTHIHHNHVHNCVLGTWLDWQAQGTRLGSNLYYSNETDLWIEVTHGPHMVDNNIFGSAHSFINAAQGGAYVHNLFCGAINRYDVRNRSTPYHLPHSTEVMGTAVVYGGDDRYEQNIFVGGEGDEVWKHGTAMYNGYTVSMEEYVETVMEKGRGDIELYYDVPQPVYIRNNCYFAGAEAFDREENNVLSDFDPQIEFREEDGKVYIEFSLPDGGMPEKTRIVKTDVLEPPRMSEAAYENPDGSSLVISEDYLGRGRAERPKPGPFESLGEGRQKILVWK